VLLHVQQTCVCRQLLLYTRTDSLLARGYHTNLAGNPELSESCKKRLCCISGSQQPCISTRPSTPGEQWCAASTHDEQRLCMNSDRSDWDTQCVAVLVLMLWPQAIVSKHASQQLPHYSLGAGACTHAAAHAHTPKIQCRQTSAMQDTYAAALRLAGCIIIPDDAEHFRLPAASSMLL
jgi:hypothetical protein